MREIKFRIPVYRHSTGAFLRFYFVTLKQGTVSFTCPAIISNDEIHKDEEQFTGLHDKKGKEIYEGDIVYIEKTKLNYKVEWIDYLFAWGWLCSKDRKTIRQNYEPEVIGNIHENPELLDNA